MLTASGDAVEAIAGPFAANIFGTRTGMVRSKKESSMTSRVVRNLKTIFGVVF